MWFWWMQFFIVINKFEWDFMFLNSFNQSTHDKTHRTPICASRLWKMYCSLWNAIPHIQCHCLCVIVYIFSGGEFLNFNNVIINKDFQNVFDYDDIPLQKKSIIEGTTFFDFILCDELKLFAQKKTYKNILIKT